MRALAAAVVALLACAGAVAAADVAVGNPPSEAPVVEPPGAEPPGTTAAAPAGKGRAEHAPAPRRSRHPDYDAALEQGDYGAAMQDALQDMHAAGDDAAYAEALERFNRAGQLQAEERREHLNYLIER
jgi:hypothetical protein